MRLRFCTSARLAFILCTATLLVAPLWVQASFAADNSDCLDCHADPDLETERGGRVISLFVDEAVCTRSVHGELECNDCHLDVDPEDLPHPERLEKVYCVMCHDDVQLDFDVSSHGQALNRDAPYAPRCKDCHGTHDALTPSDPGSQAFKMNVPYLCGGCHREGAPVARTYDIGEHNIIENYSQSIHGQGLFQKGLTVTATCTDCHESHLVLPHTNPLSSIAPRNVAKACMKCHARIEQVHTQVIRGELWEREPGAIPACTDCHLPHRVRKETTALTLADRECLKCHEQPDLYKEENGDRLSMTVSKEEIDGSVHQNIACVKCHSDIDPRLERPCEPAGPADCANCHAKISEEYNASGHGVAFANNVSEAPRCTTCHGDHTVRSHRDEDAPVFRAQVPTLCGECHREDGAATRAADLSETSALTDYSSSVHGRGLTEKGLLPSAVCIDCHGSHLVLKHTDERSTVFARNVAATCATCHRGIYKQYTKSVHFATEQGHRRLPNCTDCHSAHTISHVENDPFMLQVTNQCGSCHDELAETYLETMHGKAYQLGYLASAKCSDCHGAHRILAVDDPASSVGMRNIVGTCQQCHEDANMRFTGYLTHATHHDPAKYPALYYTYWAMTILLVGVFGFFGLHTLLWLPRTRYYIQRFTIAQRLTHVFVILSFMTLALTGMMLKFSAMPWAAFVADLLGGVRVAGIIHRIAACVTFGYFLFHLAQLARFKKRRRLSLRQLIFGRNSLMFNVGDARDFWGTLKWFFGRGPRPQYGRWTYWEKFDYMAVFWGVAVIGISGLMLWFPEQFTLAIPGRLINVATIVHSDEALLAVGFIFTIHFFNTHLRPEVFPMDTVIFTGLVPLDEYRKDRPADYARLKKNGELAKRVRRHGMTRRREIAVRVFGYTFLCLGVTVIGLIIHSVLFGYG
jgi:cytochrome b subunit of formate dehydrogenase